MSELEALSREIEALRGACERLRAGLSDRFVGQADVVEELVCALLAGGHVLIEGAPGLGKTMLVRVLATTLDLEFRRIQCTPDLVPSDVTGTRILDVDERGARRFRFERGPVFTNVLLADEINRATPRTQAALLEAMAEHQVTAFGETHALEQPFFVVATQNPIEMEGTYPLPEAQLDRFLLKIVVRHPSTTELTTILERTSGELEAPVERALTRAELVRARVLVRELPASRDVLALVARTIGATQPDDSNASETVRASVRHGASPRGAQAIVAAAKARAFLAGRLHVAEEDVERFVVPTLRHRVLLSYEGEARGVRSDEIARGAFADARQRKK